MLGLPLYKVIIDLYKIKSNKVCVFVNIYFRHLIYIYLTLWVILNFIFISPYIYCFNIIFLVAFIYCCLGSYNVGLKEIDTKYAFDYISKKYLSSEEKINKLKYRFIEHLKVNENPNKVNLADLAFILYDDEGNVKIGEKYKFEENEDRLQEILKD